MVLRGILMQKITNHILLKNTARWAEKTIVVAFCITSRQSGLSVINHGSFYYSIDMEKKHGTKRF